MGLGLEVGILADLQGNDDEGYDYYVQQFRLIDEALRSEGLPLHKEPKRLTDLVPWSCDMWSYSGLHYLRRIAAHLWQGQALPAPGAQDVNDDPVLAHFYSLNQPPHDEAGFAHLIFHSDSDGFYLPQTFRGVITPGAALEIAGGAIGSCPMLLEECQKLATELELPLQLDIESDEFWQAAEKQGEGDLKWKRYGIESFTCSRLIRACEVSIESGCALVFV